MKVRGYPLNKWKLDKIKLHRGSKRLQFEKKTEKRGIVLTKNQSRHPLVSLLLLKQLKEFGLGETQTHALLFLRVQEIRVNL